MSKWLLFIKKIILLNLLFLINLYVSGKYCTLLLGVLFPICDLVVGVNMQEEVSNKILILDFSAQHNAIDKLAECPAEIIIVGWALKHLFNLFVEVLVQQFRPFLSPVLQHIILCCYAVVVVAEA